VIAIAHRFFTIKQIVTLKTGKPSRKTQTRGKGIAENGKQRIWSAGQFGAGHCAGGGAIDIFYGNENSQRYIQFD